MFAQRLLKGRTEPPSSGSWDTLADIFLQLFFPYYVLYLVSTSLKCYYTKISIFNILPGKLFKLLQSLKTLCLWTTSATVVLMKLHRTGTRIPLNISISWQNGKMNRWNPLEAMELFALIVMILDRKHRKRRNECNNRYNWMYKGMLAGVLWEVLSLRSRGAVMDAWSLGKQHGAAAEWKCCFSEYYYKIKFVLVKALWNPVALYQGRGTAKLFCYSWMDQCINWPYLATEKKKLCVRK